MPDRKFSRRRIVNGNHTFFDHYGRPAGGGEMPAIRTDSAGPARRGNGRIVIETSWFAPAWLRAARLFLPAFLCQPRSDITACSSRDLPRRPCWPAPSPRRSTPRPSTR
ncbi:protein of unknown function [Rhodovastum atsumiense]|nr:protein of unknown function [Rhodovastum atsumiense]